jgi:hypothetical protein
MKRLVIASAGLIGTVAAADDLQGIDRLLCAVSQVIVCAEQSECFTVLAWEIGVPEFVVVDLDKKTLSTTKASQENRTTAFTTLSRTDGNIYLQGMENGRAFSFVIHEETGNVTVAVSRDGLTVTVFGVCTDADI